VIRTVYHLALEETTASSQWRHSTTNRYHILYLSSNPSLDLCNKASDYQADGMLAALYMTYLAVGPDPISPFIILATSVDSIQDFHFGIEFARATLHDLDTLARVEEILLLHADEVNWADPSRANLIALTVEQEIYVS
jgi:hypothetical protein